MSARGPRPFQTQPQSLPGPRLSRLAAGRRRRPSRLGLSAQRVPASPASTAPGVVRGGVTGRPAATHAGKSEQLRADGPSGGTGASCHRAWMGLIAGPQTASTCNLSHEFFLGLQRQTLMSFLHHLGMAFHVPVNRVAAGKDQGVGGQDTCFPTEGCGHSWPAWGWPSDAVFPLGSALSLRAGAWDPQHGAA